MTALPNILVVYADDLGETTNLYFEHSEIVRKLKALLEQTKRSERSIDHG